MSVCYHGLHIALLPNERTLEAVGRFHQSLLEGRGRRWRLTLPLVFRSSLNAAVVCRSFITSDVNTLNHEGCGRGYGSFKVERSAVCLIIHFQGESFD